jgi:hypothetical protein
MTARVAVVIAITILAGMCAKYAVGWGIVTYLVICAVAVLGARWATNFREGNGIPE